MATAFITHSDCRRHEMGFGHPECPERLDAIRDHLIACGLDARLVHHEAPLAEVEQLLRVHPPAYVEFLRLNAPTAGLAQLDPDTAMGPGTWQAALRAAGAGVLAVDLVMRGEVRGGVMSAFCAVRPPGHHAGRAAARGFCFFNNVAVAVMHAIEAWGLRRVAIADFDVHHGNGTEEIFAGDGRVLMVGTFQHPFYPFSGTENPAPNMCNVPLAAGTRGAGFRRAVDEDWLPRLAAFAPELILVSAGFDAHLEDGMASLGLVEDDYAWVTGKLKEVAGRSAGGRIVSMLEGGYALSALARSAAAHIGVLAAP
ncbi:MAG: histone deacetylase family protein [Candidatus Nitricoxidivorans perseverans]|uniref:Histone deacetylase family protein n=1 Tax=Candidatus Nitricoxidivorans perseverans TaxID=2975601 RepID=A0AA49FL38_9PROT|nr:MAG: histone deacetylase family protein [Candidatus Nitricoxidivorans perseverans]